MSRFDDFFPNPEHVEADSITVAAPVGQAYEVARHWDLAKAPLARLLFRLRTEPGGEVDEDALTLDRIGGEGPGFRLIEDQPPRHFLIGAIGEFWRPSIPFRDFEPHEFAGFSEPGLGKILWGLEFEPLGPHATRIRLEVRIGAHDPKTWKRFRRYYRLIGPFSRWIRKDALDRMQQELGSVGADEAQATLPGDERIANAKAQATHAITIDAAPERVWPWLVQMGCGRGGWYSYDLLDNGGRPSATAIIPELQQLAVGDVLATSPKDPTGFFVSRLEPARVLELGAVFGPKDKSAHPIAGSQPKDWPSPYWAVTWSFVLEPWGTRQTRLITRARLDFGPTGTPRRAWYIRPLHAFMEHRQLDNLKRRVEQG